MKKLRTIYMALLHRNEKILKKKDIRQLVTDYSKKFEKINIDNALWYLSRHNYIRRIFLDYYYINSIEEREIGTCQYEDKELLFEVLNRENVKWYLGLNSAKYYLGEIWQLPVALTIVNDRFSGKKRVNGLRVTFRKMKDNLIFGLISRKTKNKVRFYYSDAQKTYLDFLYFKLTRAIPPDVKTKTYAKKFPRWIFKE